MLNPNFIILYVDDPTISAAFYAALFNQKPLELSPTFILFSLESGLQIGLKAKHSVEPATTILGGGTELVFTLSNNDAVHALYADWKNHGLTILQKPTELVFGFTFVALDPDCHRLRVCAPKLEK